VDRRGLVGAKQLNLPHDLVRFLPADTGGPEWVPRRISEGNGMCFQAIDIMVDRVNSFKVDPEFTQQIEDRRNLVADFSLKDDEILRQLIELIAYSNNANAQKVTDLVVREVFRPIFQDYSVEKTAVLLAEELRRLHWPEIRSIRFRYKVDAMVRCASCLIAIRNSHDSFMHFIRDAGLPVVIRSEADVVAFWEGFEKVQTKLLQLRFPYITNFTSLCHLLMMLGFDCAKPDLVVMRAAVNLGVVPPPQKQKKNPDKDRAHSEESLRDVVRTIQSYALSRKTRAPVTDLYFLIHGGQSDSIGLVGRGYYA
jgi:hypothetical protein